MKVKKKNTHTHINARAHRAARRYCMKKNQDYTLSIKFGKKKNGKISDISSENFPFGSQRGTCFIDEYYCEFPWIQ